MSLSSTTNYIETNHVLLKVDGLKKVYGRMVILDNLSLEIKNVRRTDNLSIHQGQVQSIIGPSGVGKSTLFNSIAGLINYDAGSVLIDNPATAPVEHLTKEDLVPSKKGMVGVVYQDYRLFEHYTVEQLLRIGLTHSTAFKKHAHANTLEEYLEWFGLENHRNKFPFQLSGGQRQRVAIAQQLLRSPQLLLMDEPFSGLDPETKLKLVDLITTIVSKNEMLTIVLISHDIKTAMQVSDMVHFIGRNRGSNNELLPGASIHHNLSIDLKKRGLAWHRNDLEKLKAISELETEVSRYFAYLSGNADSYTAQ